MDDLEADTLKAIEAALVRYNLKPSAFGRLAIGDGNLVSEMRDGRRNLTTKTIRKINDCIATLEAQHTKKRKVAR